MTVRVGDIVSFVVGELDDTRIGIATERKVVHAGGFPSVLWRVECDDSGNSTWVFESNLYSVECDTCKEVGDRDDQRYTEDNTEYVADMPTATAPYTGRIHCVEEDDGPHVCGNIVAKLW